MDCGLGAVEGIESLHRFVETFGVEPQPGEQDAARVHVPLLLVAVVAGEHGVPCAARSTARDRDKMIAARGIGVGLLFKCVD